MDGNKLTHWHQQHIQNTAAVVTDSSKHSACTCEDSTNALNNRSVSQQHDV